MDVPVRIDDDTVLVGDPPAAPAGAGLVRLDGADHIGIDSLNIVATGTAAGEYGYGVHLYNGADSNTISRCSISLNKATSQALAYQHAGIVIVIEGVTGDMRPAVADENLLAGIDGQAFSDGGAGKAGTDDEVVEHVSLLR